MYIIRSIALIALFLLGSFTQAAIAADEHSSAEGVIEVIHVDASPPHFSYSLKEQSGEIQELEFLEPPKLRSGSTVRVHGRALHPVSTGRRILVDSYDVILEAPPAVTLGEQRVLTLMVNFQDAPLEPWTATQVKASCEGTVNDFYDENSDAQTWFTCETYGWYTIPINAADCQVGLVSQMADDAALAAGHDPSLYERVAYVTAGAAGTHCISASTIGASADGYSKTWMINQTHWGAPGFMSSVMRSASITLWLQPHRVRILWRHHGGSASVAT